MSLSRILNDEPSPALSARSSFGPSLRTMPATAVPPDVSSSSSSAMTAPPPRPLQHRSQSDAFGPLPSAPSHSENEKWPHPGQWSSGHEDTPFDSARNGRDRGSHQPISPVERLPPPPQSLAVPDEPLNGKPEEPAPKKRRKSAKNDTDNAPANGGQRRVCFHSNASSFAVVNNLLITSLLGNLSVPPNSHNLNLMVPHHSALFLVVKRYLGCRDSQLMITHPCRLIWRIARKYGWMSLISMC